MGPPQIREPQVVFQGLFKCGFTLLFLFNKFAAVNILKMYDEKYTRIDGLVMCYKSLVLKRHREMRNSVKVSSDVNMKSQGNFVLSPTENSLAGLIKTEVRLLCGFSLTAAGTDNPVYNSQSAFHLKEA